VDIYKAFKTDQEAERLGKWFSIDPWGDSEFLLAYQGNPEFKQYHAELLRPYRVELSAGTMSEETREEIETKALSEKIVLGWKNVQNGTGEEIPYSPEKAAELLRALPHLRRRIWTLTVNWENFREADKEAAIKN